MFPFTAVSVKSEDDEDKQQQRQTEQMETGADGEDCGGAEPERDSDPERRLQPEIEVKIEDSSEPETEDREDDWNDTKENQSGLTDFLRNDVVFHSATTFTSDRRKQVFCSDSDQTFNNDHLLRIHRNNHTGEKLFSGSGCENQLAETGSLGRHITNNQGVQGGLKQEDQEPPLIKEEQQEFRISHADNIQFPFTPVSVKSEDDEEKPQSSQLHQRQTEQMETGVDEEDCGGAEPERYSDPERRLQPETEVKIEDSSEPETEYREDDRKETREHESGLNSVESITNKRTKTDTKSHDCSECEKTFKTKRHLNRHKLIHTGEKPFICSECGKKFNRKAHLLSHMSVHTGEKPYGCSDCSKRFSLKGALTSHILIHTGEKPFSCSDCGRKFNNKSNLTRHMLIHKGGEPYSCSVCDQRFSSYYFLKKHECVGGQTSELHQNQPEKREEDAGADGEDCGGAEPERNSDPERHLQPEIEVEIEDCSESENEDSDDDQSDVNSVENKTNKKKLHSCSECGKTFTTKWFINQHMRIHAGEKPFSCPVCGQTFARTNDLTNHTTVHSSRRKPSKRSECGKRYIMRPSLLAHQKRLKKDKPYSCSACDQEFSLNDFLKNHKCVGGQTSELHQNQTDEKREAVTGSDSRAGSAETEVKTEYSSEPETKDREYDGKETRGHQSDLNSVENKANIKKCHSCSECGKTFRTKSSVDQHMRLHIREKPFSCSVCGQTFAQKNQLTKHMIVHRSRKKPFKCSDCGKRYIMRYALLSHQELHKKKLEIKLYGCAVCNKRYKSLSALLTHRETHTGEKLFGCSECGQRFAGKRSLMAHKLVHKQERPFSYSECDKKLENKSDHTYVHTGETPFSCSVCTKRFTRKASLITHMLVHTVGKPFSCSECCKRFKLKSMLTKHMRNHKWSRLPACLLAKNQRKRASYITHLGE